MRDLQFLPVSTASFRDIIEGDFLYVDKTELIHKLIEPAKGAYFLSRPRRFGKSLLISILDEIFQGNQELFKGLWIDSSDYGWETHPIIRIDFGSNSITNPDELIQFIDCELQRIAQEHEIELLGFNYQTRFHDLICQLGNEKQIVILIDEYDKPILDNILDLDKAEQLIDVLRGFYGVVKAMNSHIHMLFITGISQFSRIRITPELNYLTDLTRQNRFATALGITENELQTNFALHIDSLAACKKMSAEELLAKIRYWYNGFRFTPSLENAYNPFSILQLFKTQRFSNHWPASNTPTFLIELIRRNGYDSQEFDPLRLSEMALSGYDIKHVAIVSLLFQTGYLTITDYDPKTRLYTLDYPNHEIESTFTALASGRS